MRQVSKTIKEAFENGSRKVSGNTTTDGKSVWLFGNKIITQDSKGNIYWTMCGYGTRTTMERLKSILGLRLHTVKGCIQLKIPSGTRAGEGEWNFHVDIDVDTSAWYNLTGKKLDSLYPPGI